MLVKLTEEREIKRNRNKGTEKKKTVWEKENKMLFFRTCPEASELCRGEGHEGCPCGPKKKEGERNAD